MVTYHNDCSPNLLLIRSMIVRFDFSLTYSICNSRTHTRITKANSTIQHMLTFKSSSYSFLNEKKSGWVARKSILAGFTRRRRRWWKEIKKRILPHTWLKRFADRCHVCICVCVCVCICMYSFTVEFFSCFGGIVSVCLLVCEDMLACMHAWIWQHNLFTYE